MYMIIHPYLGYNNCPDNVLLIFTGKNKIKQHLFCTNKTESVESHLHFYRHWLLM